ncbi:MAG: sugar transferase [candidate division WOR-3 bacterium]
MAEKEEGLKSSLSFIFILSFLFFFLPGIIFRIPFILLIILYFSFLFFSYLFGIFESVLPPFYGTNPKTQIIFLLLIFLSFFLGKGLNLGSVPFLSWLILWLSLNILEPVLNLILRPQRKIPILLVTNHQSNPYPKILDWCRLEPVKVITKEEMKNYLPTIADRLGRIKEFRALILEEVDTEIKNLMKNYLADFFLLKSCRLFSYFAGCPLKRVEDFPFFTLTMRLKRVIDFLLSLCIITLLAPFLLFIILCIKLDSPGPIFYRHKRIGRKGRSFYLLKFRTMVKDADKRLAAILASDPKLREEFARTYKLKNDPRVTTLGKFLRSLSIDELPQLFNVLKGEMSLVGPRPIVEDEIKYYENASRLPFKFFPGVTGLWQVSGRTDTSYAQRVALDEKYCHNWHLLMDIKIILKTIPAVLSQRGAY